MIAVELKEGIVLYRQKAVAKQGIVVENKMVWMVLNCRGITVEVILTVLECCMVEQLLLVRGTELWVVAEREDSFGDYRKENKQMDCFAAERGRAVSKRKELVIGVERWRQAMGDKDLVG
jgi:hypothetical protein